MSALNQDHEPYNSEVAFAIHQGLQEVADAIHALGTNRAVSSEGTRPGAIEFLAMELAERLGSIRDALEARY